MFSENGYHIAVLTDDGCITIWDLRKKKKISSVVSYSDDDDNDNDDNDNASVLAFDLSGKYLAFGTTSGKIGVMTVKDLEKKVMLNNNNNGGKGKSGKVTGLVWGVDSLSLISSYENDRGIHFWDTKNDMEE